MTAESPDTIGNGTLRFLDIRYSLCIKRVMARRRRACIKVLQRHAVAVNDEDDDEDSDDDDLEPMSKMAASVINVSCVPALGWCQNEALHDVPSGPNAKLLFDCEVLML